MAGQRKPGVRLTPYRKIAPLPADKPLAPYRVPALKAFDSCMPGQAALDFGSDDPDTEALPKAEA